MRRQLFFVSARTPKRLGIALSSKLHLFVTLGTARVRRLRKRLTISALAVGTNEHLRFLAVYRQEEFAAFGAFRPRDIVVTESCFAVFDRLRDMLRIIADIGKERRLHLLAAANDLFERLLPFCRQSRRLELARHELKKLFDCNSRDLTISYTNRSKLVVANRELLFSVVYNFCENKLNKIIK